ncbi:MAG: hypothetical protein ABSF87_17960, partial [Xanthobacteraceae bacterium]
HLRSANHAATLRQVIPSCESPPKYPPRSLAILTHLITGEALDEESRISLPLYYDFGSGFIM